MGQFVTFWLLFGQRFYTFGLLFMPTSGHAVETEVDHFVLEATKCKLFNFGFSQITSYPFRQKYLVKLKVKGVWRKCKNETAVVVFRGKKLYPMQLFGFMFARHLGQTHLGQLQLCKMVDCLLTILAKLLYNPLYNFLFNFCSFCLLALSFFFCSTIRIVENTICGFDKFSAL